jgi:DNA-binding NarL/FixJ family response regulator
MTTPITVAIVDDNDAVRTGWMKLINRSSFVRCISTYATAKDALQHIPLQPPAVILMDICMPGMSGIECTARLKALCPELCIIMLTTFGDSDNIFEALQAGASGYLLKHVTSGTLIKSIREAHRGGVPMSAQIAQQVLSYFRAQQPREPITGALTTREHELLSLLAKGQFYKEIADALNISIETVRSHIRSIYEKLHVHSRTEAVVKFLHGNQP